MSLFLSKDELRELTGYVQKDKVAKALLEMKIDFDVRPADGFILVDRDYRGRKHGAKKAPKPLNWEALDG